MARNDHIWIFWVSAHKGVQGNETADEMAKKAAGGQSNEAPDRVPWQVNLPHLSWRATDSANGLAFPTKVKTFWVIKYLNIYSANKWGVHKRCRFMRIFTSNSPICDPIKTH